MALIKCPECGRENISDSADACPSCGFGIKQYFIEKHKEEKRKIEEERRKKEEDERKKREEEETRKKEEQLRIAKEEERKRKEFTKKFIKRLIPSMAIMLVIVTAFAIGSHAYKRHKDFIEYGAAYQEAVDIYNAERYEDALQKFLRLGDYEDSQEYVERCEVNIPLKKYKNGFYVQAYIELSKLLPESYEKVTGIPLKNVLDECRQKCADSGHQAFADKKYSDAEKCFEICYEYDDISYKEEYLAVSKLSTMKTYWYYFRSLWGEEKYAGMIHIGDTVSVTDMDDESLGIKDGTYTYEIKDDALYIQALDIYIYPPQSEDAEYLFVKKVGQSHKFYRDRNYVKKKAEEEARIKAANAPKEPRVGMTASEVRASTWGEPKDINKTTYEWGTHEQWCYPHYKYIYFEDGIVTAIQE